MSSPSAQEIRAIAKKHGYFERTDLKSKTLFFERWKSRSEDRQYPDLINVFYTTRGVMTKIKHPKGGYNQLWRSDAYDSLESLEAIFKNPRIHTGKGYRRAGNALRGCAQCGMQKERSKYSSNQWRKGPGSSQCSKCVEQKQEERQRARIGSTSGQQQGNHDNHNDDVKPFVHRTGMAVLQEIPTVDAGYGSKESATSWDSLVDCIKCDAEGCDEAANIRCSRCEMAYYCSAQCKVRHCDEHMSDLCRDVNEMRVMNAAMESRNPDDQSLRGWAHATQLSGNRTFKALLAQAEYIHQADQNWKAALLLYNDLMVREQWEGSAPEWRQLYMGASRCFYEIGLYEESLGCGIYALEMNRMFPQIRKYIALSQRDSGDLRTAIQTMKEAVLYEAPYDDEKKALNVDLLWEMMCLER